MKTYKIFSNPQGNHKAIKQGWSWPGFFFTAIWAAFKRMWWLAIGTFLLIGIIGSVFDQMETEVGFIPFIVNLLLFIVYGINGNKWWEKKLISHGYDYQDTINAGNHEAAIALWLKK
jgi:hypothetical protein